MKKSIVWLSSYPKSGNTWVRIFLANYIANRDKPLSINQVRYFGTGDSIKCHYDKLAGRSIDPPDILGVLSLRQKLLNVLVGNGADINVVKTHNIKSNIRGVDLFPTNVTRCAIYILRNPLDMVISYASHYGLSQAEAASAIASSDNAVLGDDATVTQFLGSWSDHVKSWTSHTDFPVLVMRYEDMLSDPHASFGKFLTHIGIPVCEERLARAIKFSAFDELAGQEEKTGFGEMSGSGARFFGKGTAGHWQRELDKNIIKKIKKDHRVIMEQYGYL